MSTLVAWGDQTPRERSPRTVQVDGSCTAEPQLHCVRGRRDGKISGEEVNQDNGLTCLMLATPAVLDDQQARASMTLAAVLGVDRSR
jgi:hypothetical protein